jgi:predicted NodU family carbamoyl transferase
MYNILSINPGHNGSIALVTDGKLQYYCEEERLSRLKYDGNPFRGMISILEVRLKTIVNRSILLDTLLDSPDVPTSVLVKER